MLDIDLATIAGLIGTGGTWLAWFAWSWSERQRNAQLQDARIRDLKSWINFLVKADIFPTQINGHDDK